MRYGFILLTLLLSMTLYAEGTREVAPNRSIVINGNSTTDIAALHIGNEEYGNFAVVWNSNPMSRLYVNIQDPAAECICLGFSVGHVNRTGIDPPSIPYSFLVKDPLGNIVYGPIVMDAGVGNIFSWEEAHQGPMLPGSTQGYHPFVVSSDDLMSGGWTGKGDYYIQFDYEPDAGLGIIDESLLIDFWDISVINCRSANPQVQKGRVWSFNWSFFAINDYGFPDRPFNGKFYVCAVDSSEMDKAFVSSVDFNNSGFRPAAFSVAFNNFGTRTTKDVQYNRRSVRNANMTVPAYPIFLNDPVDIYGTPDEGNIEYIDMVRGDDGFMCFKVLATRSGVVEILLDFHKEDGIYTEDTEDVLLSYNISQDEVGKVVCVPWHGMDGKNKAIMNQTFPIQLMYNRGILHFPIFDGEYLENGFRLEKIRPGGDPPLLFYDDSEIIRDSGSGEPKVNLDGCETPCHSWDNYVDPEIIGFGNMNTINSWWYSTQRKVDSRATIEMQYYIPNAFTPNGDGLNDYARVFLDDMVYGVKNYEVFDRWGNRVYEEAYANGIRDMKGWNGEYRGFPMYPAVFMYKATIEVHPGVYVIEHGTLTLIR